jgi:hypothetical protein
MAGFTTKTFRIYDDYMTPKEAWEAIKDHIPNNKVIWEPFYGDGNSGQYLKDLGFNVIHEDIDFFENNKGDIVVSNPPFSKKKEVIKRLIELDKPFILIMPCSTLVCSYVRDMLGDLVQIIVPRKRIQFSKLEDGKLINNGKCNFDCFYYCYKINLTRDILYLR